MVVQTLLSIGSHDAMELKMQQDYHQPQSQQPWAAFEILIFPEKVPVPFVLRERQCQQYLKYLFGMF